MKEPEYTAEHFESPQDITPNQFDITDLIRAEQTLGSWLPGGDPSVWIVTKLNKTKDERDKLMFRVRVRIDPARLLAAGARVKTGLPGLGYVLLDPATVWPVQLQPKPLQ